MYAICNIQQNYKATPSQKCKMIQRSYANSSRKHTCGTAAPIAFRSEIPQRPISPSFADTLCPRTNLQCTVNAKASRARNN